MSEPHKVDHTAGVALTHPAIDLDLPPLPATVHVAENGTIHFKDHTSGTQKRHVDLADITAETQATQPADASNPQPTGPFCNICLDVTHNANGNIQTAIQLAKRTRKAARNLHRWRQAAESLQAAAELLENCSPTDVDHSLALRTYESSVRQLRHAPNSRHDTPEEPDNLTLHMQQLHNQLIREAAPTLHSYRTAATQVLHTRAAADHVAATLEGLSHPNQEQCTRWHLQLTQLLDRHHPDRDTTQTLELITTVVFTWWELRSHHADIRRLNQHTRTTLPEATTEALYDDMRSTYNISTACVETLCRQLDEWADSHQQQHKHKPARRTVLQPTGEASRTIPNSSIATTSLLLHRPLQVAATRDRHSNIVTLTPAGWHPVADGLRRVDAGQATTNDTEDVLNTVDRMLAEIIPAQGPADPAAVTTTWSAIATAHTTTT